MTEEQKREIREIDRMSAFTFYIDNLTKLEVIKKLKRLGIDEKKGSLAATIRVLLRWFANDIFSKDALTCEEFDDTITESIKAEYLFTTKKNKRSNM